MKRISIPSSGECQENSNVFKDLREERSKNKNDGRKSKGKTLICIETENSENT